MHRPGSIGTARSPRRQRNAEETIRLSFPQSIHHSHHIGPTSRPQAVPPHLQAFAPRASPAGQDEIMEVQGVPIV